MSGGPGVAGGSEIVELLKRRFGWVVVIGIAIAAFAVGILCGRDGAARGSASAAPERATRAVSAPDEGRTQAAALDSRLRLLEQRALARESEARSAPPASAGPRAPGATPERRAAQAARMQKFEQMLEQRVSGEPSDPAWSVDVSRSVQQHIGSLGTPIGFESTRCSAAFCAVTFTHPEAEAHQALFNALVGGEKPALGFGGPALIRRHPKADGGYRTTIYLAKVGARLPKMPNSDAANSDPEIPGE